MYYHYQRQRAADPCGEVGGFTRMLNSATGQPGQHVTSCFFFELVLLCLGDGAAGRAYGSDPHRPRLGL